jgi:chromosome segregation ATPase
MEELTQIRTDIGVIKSEIGDMKVSLTNAVEKISDSMAKMAAVSEKLNHNTEEHRHMSERINNIEETQEEQKEKLFELKTTHAQCMEQRKLEEDKKKNSPWQKGKDKAVEWIFVLLVGLVLFVLVSHFGEFTKYMNNTGNSNPVQMSK